MLKFYSSGKAASSKSKKRAASDSDSDDDVVGIELFQYNELFLTLISYPRRKLPLPRRRARPWTVTMIW